MSCRLLTAVLQMIDGDQTEWWQVLCRVEQGERVSLGQILTAVASHGSLLPACTVRITDRIPI